MYFSIAARSAGIFGVPFRRKPTVLTGGSYIAIDWPASGDWQRSPTDTKLDLSWTRIQRVDTGN